jgi:NAD(P)H-flavin reductase
MLTGQGELREIFLQDDGLSGRITCPSGLVPAPGQFLLASRPGSDAPLPVPLFKAADSAGGFIAAAPLPESWLPGATLHLRGPLGRGFSLPKASTRLALIALGATPARLLALLPQALAQNASVVLVSGFIPADLPAAVEVRPLADLPEIRRWSDFLAADLPREKLSTLRGLLGLSQETPFPIGQSLIHVPMPCGALAECGVCAVTVRRGYRLACKDGPIFDLSELG